jgi:hypothetical protein
MEYAAWGAGFIAISLTVVYLFGSACRIGASDVDSN